MHPERHLSTRCGMMATLAIIDILFHANRYASGLLSILWHGLTAFSLYLLTAGLINRKTALLMALAFVCQFGGMEMVYWRHISPYMFCLAFWGFAMKGIRKLEEDEKPGQDPRRTSTKMLVIVLFLTGAILYHEVALFAVAAGTVLFFILDSLNNWPLFKRDPIKSFWRNYRLTWLCLLPVFLALIINFYQVFQSLPTTEGKTQLLSWTVLNQTIDFTGALTTAWAFPREMALTFSNDLGRFIWKFSALPRQTTWALGLASVLADAILWGSGLRQYLKKDQRSQAASLLLSLIFTGVLIGSLFFLRGTTYMEGATYYLYLFIYLNYYFLSEAMNRLRTSELPILRYLCRQPLSSVVMTTVSIFLLTHTVWGYQGIQKALSVPNFQNDAFYADTVLAISRLMKQKPNYCFGGTTDTSKTSRLDIMLRRYECADMDDPRTPVYLTLRQNKFLFQTLRAPKNTVRLNAMQISNRLSFTASPLPSMPIADRPILLSDKAYDPVAFAVRLKSANDTFLTLAVRDARNAVMIQPIKRYLTTTAIIHDRDVPLDWVLGNFEGEYTLSFYKIDNDYYLFRNRNIVLHLKNLQQIIPNLTGYLGVGCKIPGSGNHFGEITLQNTDGSKPEVFSFEPVPDLPAVPS
jgi:hypothetical protein